MFFSQRVINRWNSLSQDDVDADSINSFKNRLEKEENVRWTSSKTSVHKSFGCTRVMNLAMVHDNIWMNVPGAAAPVSYPVS